MERNKTLRIDPETMDIPIDENGDMEYIYGDDTTAQCVRLTLLTWKGTFPLAGCNFRVFTYCAFYTAPGTIYCATYRPFCQGRGI